MKIKVTIGAHEPVISNIDDFVKSKLDTNDREATINIKDAFIHLIEVMVDRGTLNATELVTIMNPYGKYGMHLTKCEFVDSDA